MSILHLTYTISDCVTNKVTQSEEIWRYIKHYRSEFLVLFGVDHGIKKVRYDNYDEFYFNRRKTITYALNPSCDFFSSTYFEYKHRYVIFDGFGRRVDPIVLYNKYQQEFGVIKYAFYEYTWNDSVIRGKSSAADTGNPYKSKGSRHRYAASIKNIKRDIASISDLQYYSKEYGFVNTLSFSGGVSLWSYETISRGEKNWKRYRQQQYKKKGN